MSSANDAAIRVRRSLETVRHHDKLKAHSASTASAFDIDANQGRTTSATDFCIAGAVNSKSSAVPTSHSHASLTPLGETSPPTRKPIFVRSISSSSDMPSKTGLHTDALNSASVRLRLKKMETVSSSGPRCRTKSKRVLPGRRKPTPVKSLARPDIALRRSDAVVTSHSTREGLNNSANHALVR